MHMFKSFFHVVQLWRHPVVRSSFMLSFVLLLGISAMTRFAAVMSDRQSEINDQIKSIIDLKHMLVFRESAPDMGEHLDNFDASLQENYGYPEHRLKKIVWNLNCIFRDFIPQDSCRFKKIREYFAQKKSFRMLKQEWQQLSQIPFQNKDTYQAFFSYPQTRAFLVRFDQFLTAELFSFFAEASQNRERFRVITFWVWVLGIGLLGALIVTHVAPILKFTSDIEHTQNHLRQLFEQVPSGILRINWEGQIQDANPATVKLLELDHPQQIVHQHFQTFLTPEAKQVFTQWLNECHRENTEKQGILEIRLGKEQVKFMETYVKPIGNPKEKSPEILVTFADVTEKMLMEKRLKTHLELLEKKFISQAKHVKAVEARYKTLFENTHAGLFLYDDQGKIIEANSVARELFRKIEWDLEAEQFHPIRGSDLVLTNILHKMKGKEKLCGEEIKVYCSGGEERYLSLFVEPFPLKEGKAKGYLCTFFDITPHIQLEKKLSRLTNYFQTIFNNTTDGIIVYDTNNVIVDMNDRLCELSGFTREELLGRGCFHLFCRKDDPREDHHCILDQIAHGSPIQTRTVELLRKNGETWFAEVDGSLLYDENGQFIGTIQILRDVTEKVIAEQQRKKLEEQLQQSQKMEVIGQLAGGVAHDFNNILTVIKGFADFALMMLEPHHPAYTYIQKIVTGVDNAANLTSQLLSFSRRKVLKLEALDLNEIVNQSMEFIQRTLGEKVKIKIETAQEPPIVNVDKTAMQQIITNLCINARDAMPKGGELKIVTAVRYIEEDYPLLPPELSPGKYVMLSISDTGIGIPKEIQDRIFEPFFTTKKPGYGTGLGLSMVYGLVKQQNGFITVYSEEGKGTEFKLFFPLTAKKGDPKPARKKRLQFQGTGKILVAEDEPLVLEVLESTLTRYGYTVLLAKNGREAWEIFQKHHQSIDLVIFDAIMPEMSGDVLLKKIQQLQPDIPLICISGYSEEGIHQNFILKEGLEYIEKPFAPEELMIKVKEILNQ